jgi:hypothetical protein
MSAPRSFLLAAFAAGGLLAAGYACADQHALTNRKNPELFSGFFLLRQQKSVQQRRRFFRLGFADGFVIDRQRAL